MIYLETIGNSETSKVQVKQIYDKQKKTLADQYKFDPIGNHRRFPLFITSSIKNLHDNSAIELDVFGRANLVPSKENVDDLLIFSFAKDEEIIGLKLIEENARSLAYDTDKKGSFNLFARIKNDGLLFTIVTKQLRVGTTDELIYAKYTITKKNNEISSLRQDFVKHAVDGKFEYDEHIKHDIGFKLCKYPEDTPKYNSIIIKKSNSKINRNLIDFITKTVNNTQGYIKLITVNDNSIRNTSEIDKILDSNDIEMVCTVDQSYDVICQIKEMMIERQSENAVVLFNQ